MWGVRVWRWQINEWSGQEQSSKQASRSISLTEPNQEGLYGVKPAVCVCVCSVSKKPQCFSVIERYCCAILAVQKEGREECARTTYLHTCLRMCTHPAGGNFLSVLFLSATVGYDTAKKKIQRGKWWQRERRGAETVMAPNVNTIWRSGLTETRKQGSRERTASENR